METGALLNNSSQLPSDLELVGLLKSDARKGMSLLLKQYDRMIHSVIAHFTQEPEEHQDYFQEILISLMENQCHRLLQWQPRARFSTYLFLLVWRLCQNYRRKSQTWRKRTVQPLSESPDGETAGAAVIAPSQRLSAALHELSSQINECFNLLHEKGILEDHDKLIFALRVDGHSAESIGKLVALKGSVVHQRYHRLRKHIRDCLGKHGFKKFSDFLSENEESSGLIE